MAQSIGNVTLVVRDYDEAIEFFTRSLGFELRQDTDLGSGKRWVVVAPRATAVSDHNCGLLLAKAVGVEQEKAIGNQSGGRVFMFLHTDNFVRDYEKMVLRDVRFLESPRHESYGTVAVFADLYGNKWDLLQLNDR
jgi:catechol 2,3-dioxygenase-like lactoylglutathione lyase family enzyme